MNFQAGTTFLLPNIDNEMRLNVVLSNPEGADTEKSVLFVRIEPRDSCDETPSCIIEPDKHRDIPVTSVVVYGHIRERKCKVLEEHLQRGTLKLTDAISPELL